MEEVSLSEMESEELTKKELRGAFGDNENILYLEYSGSYMMYTFVKNYKTIKDLNISP